MPVAFPVARPLPRKRQPSGDLRIDWSNPLTKNLVFYCPYGDGRFVDLVNGVVPSTNVPGDNRRATAFGSMLYTDDTSSNGFLYGLNEDIDTAGISLSFTIVPDAASIRSFGHVFLAEDTGGSDITRFSQNSTTAGSFRFHVGTSQVATVTASASVPSHIVCTLDEPSNDWAVYVNGVLSASGNLIGTRPPLQNLWVGRFSGAGYTVSGAIGGLGVWKRALRADEVAQINENRNVILTRPGGVLMLPSAVGGGTPYYSGMSLMGAGA